MRLVKILTVVAFVLVAILIFYKGPKQRAPKYSAATEVTVKGVVQEVRQFWCPVNGDEGTHLMLKTDTGILEVHVAPRRFLHGNGVSFSQGDQIAVVGSMVIYEGHDAMIAREITRGDQTFAFRQPGGRPLWVERLRTYVR
jgi:DNA/RNA endonuclease YhcR with UshA esterase domain